MNYDMIHVEVVLTKGGKRVTGTMISLTPDMLDEVGARVHDAINRRLEHGDKRVKFPTPK